MNFASRLNNLLPAKRWQRRLVGATLILAVILGAQYGRTRGILDAAAPPLVVVLTVGAGDTVTPVAFLSAGSKKMRPSWAETSPA